MAGPRTMFGGQLVYHGVDVEAVARRALATYCAKKQANLSHADREDAVAYLTSEGWIAAERYDPSRRTQFSSVLYSTLSFRTTDWFRLRFGRTRWTFSTHEYVRERPVPLSLDGPAGSGGDAGSLGEALADRGGDGETDRLADIAGLHGGGSLERD